MVKLFTPDAAATWLVTGAYLEGADFRLFGLCDLGLGSPELGYLILSEIEDVREKLSLPVERGFHFEAEHRRRHAGMIVT